MDVTGRAEVRAYRVMHSNAIVRIGYPFTRTSSCEPRTEMEDSAQADSTGNTKVTD